MEEIVFKTRVDTGTTAKDLNQVEESLSGIDSKVKAVDSSLEELKKISFDEVVSSSDSLQDKFDKLNKKIAITPKTLNGLNAQMEAYKSIALQAERTDPIRQEAIDKASQLQDKITDLGNEVARLADDQKNLKGVMEIGQATIAGYGALNGMMALAGENGEQMRETLVKLQAVQTTLTSLDQIRTSLQKESNAMLLIGSVRTKAMAAATVAYAGAQAALNFAMGTGTKAMKIFRLALISTGIGALIVGIGLLVANFSKLKGFFTGEKKIAKWFKIAFFPLYVIIEIVKATIAGISELINMFTAESRARSEANKKAEAERKARMAAAKREREEKKRAFDEEIASIDRTIALYQAQGKDVTELTKKKIRASIEVQKALLLEADAARKVSQQYENSADTFERMAAQGLKTSADISDEAQKNILDLENQLKIVDIEAEKRNADKAKARQKEREQEEADARTRLRLLEDLTIKSIEEESSRRLMELSIRHKREREDLIQKYGQDTELLKELELSQAKELNDLNKDIESKKKAEEDKIQAEKLALEKKAAEEKRKNEVAQLEGEIIQLRDDFYAKLEVEKELALIKMENDLAQENLTEGEKFKIRQEYDQKIEELENKAKDRSVKLDKEANDTRKKLLEQGFKAAQDLTDAVFAVRLSKVEKGSKAEEKIAKKQFMFNKALQLSGAIMDSSKAVMASLASAPVAIGAVPNPAGIASLAFVVAQSGASIAKILATKFEGGGGGSSPSVGAPSISSGGNDSQGGGIPQADSTLTAGLQGSGQQQPSKVVLVDSDVKAGLAENNKVEMISSVGG